MMAASGKAKAREKRTMKTTSGLGPPSCKIAEIDGRGLAESKTIEKQRIRRQKRATETTSGLHPPSWKMAEIDWGSLGQSQTIEQQRKTTRPMRKNVLRKLLPVCGRRLGKWRISTAPASDTRNPSSNLVGVSL